MRITRIRTKTSEISLIDEKRLLQPEELDPKLSSNLIDSILNYDKKTSKKNYELQNPEKAKENNNKTKNEQIFQSIDVKKHEMNKKLINEIIINRILLERKKNKAKNWSAHDFEIKEIAVMRDSLNNFKALSILMNKTSTQHILNKDYLKSRIKDQLKKQESDKGILIDKEELKNLKNIKEEFMDDLKKNQHDYEEYQIEISKRNNALEQLRLDICNLRRQISANHLKVI